MDHASFAESQHAQLRKRENMEMGVLTPAEASLPQPCLGLRADRGEREVRTMVGSVAHPILSKVESTTGVDGK